MFRRRDLIKLVAVSALSPKPTLAQTASGNARTLNPEWALERDFLFRKTLRSAGFGVPQEDFPFERVRELISTRPVGAYEEIVKIFQDYIAYPLDPAGALVAVPDHALRSIELMDTPPRLGSTRFTGELLELYWATKFRDLPFEAWNDAQLVRRAVDDLQAFKLGHSFSEPHRSLFSGPWDGVPGDQVSAFLLADIPRWPDQLPQTY